MLRSECESDHSTAYWLGRDHNGSRALLTSAPHLISVKRAPRVLHVAARSRLCLPAVPGRQLKESEEITGTLESNFGTRATRTGEPYHADGPGPGGVWDPTRMLGRWGSIPGMNSIDSLLVQDVTQPIGSKRLRLCYSRRREGEFRHNLSSQLV